MGHLHILRDFYSWGEHTTRTLRIYTPTAYDLEPDRTFGVLYMHDGQNVFAHPDSARYDTWCANEAMESLAGAGEIEPWLVVGIDHGPDRMHDYSPWDEPRANVQGRGERYSAFLVDHVKPYIDRTYRTRPEAMWTATLGASLGGVISLYLGLAYPHVFGRLGGVSPTLMWSDGALFRHWQAHTRHWSRIYLDAGDREFVHVGGMDLNYGEVTQAFYRHLKSLGYADHEVWLNLEPGGAHYEADWRRRLPDAFRWLLG